MVIKKLWVKLSFLIIKILMMWCDGTYSKFIQKIMEVTDTVKRLLKEKGNSFQKYKKHVLHVGKEIHKTPWCNVQNRNEKKDKRVFRK